MQMRSQMGLALLAVAILAQPACATLHVSSYVDRKVDFSRYVTFDWGPADALPPGDPRLDTNPVFRDRLQGAVERHLAARGFERAAPGAEPDILIHYHANVTRRIGVSHADRAYGYALAPQAEIREYEASTIVLDIVDRQTHTVVWRGWAQRDMRDMLDDDAAMARRIDDAVRRMLARLPAAF